MEIHLRPEPKQHLTYNHLLNNDGAKYILLGGAAGGGKTWTGCEWETLMCLKYPETRWFIGRKELKRLMQSSFITFKKVCRWHKIPDSMWKLNGQYNYIEFTNGSVIDLLDLSLQPSDPMFERFGSLEYTGGWIEEAGEVDFRAFDVLKSRINRCNNREYNLEPHLLLTCNPTKNWLKRLFYTPWKNGTLDSNKAFIPAFYTDNSYTSKTYGENLSEISDTAMRQRLRDGNWDYADDDNALMKYDAIADLFTNTVDDGEKYMTIDVASEAGVDKTVIILWKGFTAYNIISVKQKLPDTEEMIKELMITDGIARHRVIIDSIGVGRGIYESITGIKGFVANARPMENINLDKREVVKNGKIVEVPEIENYGMLKDQCSYMFADMTNKHQIAIKTNDEKIKEMIIQELEQIKNKNPHLDGKQQVIPKDLVKEAIGRSPDLSDALIMRMYFCLTNDDKLIDKNRQKQENDRERQIASQLAQEEFN